MFTYFEFQISSVHSFNNFFSFVCLLISPTDFTNYEPFCGESEANQHIGMTLSLVCLSVYLFYLLVHPSVCLSVILCLCWRKNTCLLLVHVFAFTYTIETSSTCNLHHRRRFVSRVCDGVILQTSPHCRPPPRKICNGTEQP